MKKSFFLFFLFLILFSSLIAAISISPPSYDLNFENNKVEKISFTISNFKETNVEIYFKGFLNEYASSSLSEFHLEPNEKQNIEITLKFPAYEDLTKYGKQALYVIATEKPLGASGISAVAAVGGTIIMHIPVPGEYAEITSFDIPSVEKGQNTNLDLTIINRGTEPLSNKKAEVILYSPTGEEQEKFEFNNINIPVGETISLSKEINSKSFTEGKYFAEAVFKFSEELEPAKKNVTFFIGSTDIVLESYTKTLTRGQINKIDLKFQSIWGSPLNGVQSEFIFNGETEKLPVLDFEPFSISQINAHPDVSANAPDEITAELKINIPNSGQKTLKMDFDVIDSGDLIIPEEPSGENKYMLLIASVIVLILFLVALNIYLLTKNKKGKNEK